MRWIILNHSVPDLLECVDPFDDFIKHVPPNDSLSALASILPSPFNTPLLRLCGKLL